MNHLFNTTRPETLMAGSCRQLIQWLEAFVDISYPGNGIEYWSDLAQSLRHFSPDVAFKLAPLSGKQTVAVYVNHSTSECPIINVAVVTQHEHVKLGFAKIHAPTELCMQIAGAVSVVLETIFYKREQPRLVDLSEMIPRLDKLRVGKVAITGPVQVMRAHMPADADGNNVTLIALADGNGVVFGTVPMPTALFPFIIKGFIEDMQAVVRALGLDLDVRIDASDFGCVVVEEAVEA